MQTVQGFRPADCNRLKPFAHARDGFARLSPKMACAVRQLHGSARGVFEDSEAHAAAGIGFPGCERLKTSAQLCDGIARLSPKLKCAVRQLHDSAHPRAQRLRFLPMPAALVRDCRRMTIAPCDSCKVPHCGVSNAQGFLLPTSASSPFPLVSAHVRPAAPGARPRRASTNPDQFRPVPTSSDQPPTRPRPVPTSSDQFRPVATSSDQFRPVPTSPDQPRPASAGLGRFRPAFRPVLPAAGKKSTTVPHFATPTRKLLETSRCRATDVWDSLQGRAGVRARCALPGEPDADGSGIPPCRLQSA